MEQLDNGLFCALYADSSSSTRYTKLACGCHHYRYSNGDQRWLNANKKYQVCLIIIYLHHHIQLNKYGNDGCSEIRLHDGTIIRHFLTGQLDIFHANDTISVQLPNGNRIETFDDGNVEM
jgi:hypothetical protein